MKKTTINYMKVYLLISNQLINNTYTGFVFNSLFKIKG